MSIEGSINVSALFHDRDGTTAMKVVSLRSANEHTTGKVAIITGTAGTAQTTIVTDGVYRDAEGSLVTITEPLRVLFAWNRSGGRTLELVDFDDFAFARITSRDNQAAATVGTNVQEFRLRASSNNTGTYTIVVYGT